MQSGRLDSVLPIEIGGTHTRCGIARTEHRPERVGLFDNADHPDLPSVIAAYLDELAGAAPRRAALAAAGPPDDGPVELTNLGWTLDRRGLEQRFGWTDTVVVNDFEALACAVPRLAPEELFPVQDAQPTPGAPVAVLGPGTGLGVSGLVPCKNRWYPISGEGGHVTLAATDDRETGIVRRLHLQYGHVSAERVLCGPGLLALYRLIAGRPKAGSPLDVTRLAGSGNEDARQALDLFFRFLGTVAGDLALTLGVRGGVYLGGGILPILKERLAESGFASRFRDKGRFSDYVRNIPVYLILAETPALRGLMVHPHVQRLMGIQVST